MTAHSLDDDDVEVQAICGTFGSSWLCAGGCLWAPPILESLAALSTVWGAFQKAQIDHSRSKASNIGVMMIPPLPAANPGRTRICDSSVRPSVHVTKNPDVDISALCTTPTPKCNCGWSSSDTRPEPDSWLWKENKGNRRWLCKASCGIHGFLGELFWISQWFFIGPRFPWGPIYGSGSLKLTNSKTLCRVCTAD